MVESAKLLSRVWLVQTLGIDVHFEGYVPSLNRNLVMWHFESSDVIELGKRMI